MEAILVLSLIGNLDKLTKISNNQRIEPMFSAKTV